MRDKAAKSGRAARGHMGTSWRAALRNAVKRLYFAKTIRYGRGGKTLMEKTTPTVVVIDDSTSVRAFIQRCADGLDVEIRAYASVSAAMAYLSDARPALVFLDIIMPDKDGLTFLQEMRRMAGYEETPVVMISSKDYAQDRMTAKDLGAVEFVAKPMSTKTVRDLIIKYTGSHTEHG